MRRILFILLLLQTVSNELKIRHVYMPDPIPEDVYDCYERDTIISGYWTIRTSKYVVYPTEIYYITQDDMEHYIDWPSKSNAVYLARDYWSHNTDSLVNAGKRFYDNGKVRVFVHIESR